MALPWRPPLSEQAGTLAVRPNLVTNSEFGDAATGVVGSGGSLGTGNSNTPCAGITATVNSINTVNGRRVLNITFAGTATASGFPAVDIQAPVSASTTYRASFMVRTVGTVTAPNGVFWNMQSWNSGKAFLQNHPGGGGAIQATETTHSIALTSDASAAFVNLNAYTQVSNGTAINVTFEVSYPLVTLGSGVERYSATTVSPNVTVGITTVSGTGAVGSVSETTSVGATGVSASSAAGTVAPSGGNVAAVTPWISPSGVWFTGAGWSNTTNVYTSDDTAAALSLGANTESGQLQINGFSGLSVPNGATISGIEVGLETAVSAGSLDNFYVYIIGPESFSTPRRSVLARFTPGSSSATDTYLVAGGPTDDFGGARNADTTERPWIPSDFTAENIGLYIVGDSGASGVTATVDHVRMRVHYTAAATSDVTVGITGPAATGLAGSVGTLQEVPETGNAAMTSVGTAVALRSQGLTNNAATTGVGTAGASLSRAITTNAATGAPGSIGSSGQRDVTTVSGTGVAGSVGTSQALVAALTGASATSSTGSVSKSNDGSLTLTGTAATGTFGSVGSTGSYAAAGNGASAAVGSLQTNTAQGAALTNVMGSSVVNGVGPVRQHEVAGQSTTPALGNVTAGSSASVVLTGISASSSTGTVNVAVPAGDRTASLTGIPASLSLGLVEVGGMSEEGTVTGVTATSSLGPIGISDSRIVALTGVAVTGRTSESVAPAWSSSAVYIGGDLVTHDGRRWTAVVLPPGVFNTNITPTSSASAYWTPTESLAVALTRSPSGVSTIGQTGSVTVGADITRALTGSFATISRGTLTGGSTRAISGNATTSQFGSLAVQIDRGINGTDNGGVGATVVLGNVGKAVPNTLTGVSFSTAVGSVSPAQSAALTSASATGLAGTVQRDTPIQLTGESAFGDPGTLPLAEPPVGTSLPAGEFALADFAAVEFAAGTNPTNVRATPAGVVAIGTAGTVGQGRPIALTGVSAAAACGSVGTTQGSVFNTPITGNQITTHTGTVRSDGLGGAAMEVFVGSVTASHAVGLTGAAATGVTGQLDQYQNLTGEAATAATGAPTASLSATLTSSAATGVTGIVGLAGGANTASATTVEGTAQAGTVGVEITAGTTGNSASAVTGEEAVTMLIARALRGNYAYFDEVGTVNGGPPRSRAPASEFVIVPPMDNGTIVPRTNTLATVSPAPNKVIVPADPVTSTL